MPRDSTATRARLLAEAERLFADQGIWQASIGGIVAAAGQRNSSALTYHFGSREGALDRILAEHGAPIDAHRGRLLADLGASLADTTIPAILDALVRPMTAHLDGERGRRYVRIVAQLSARFPTWRQDATTLDQPELVRALDVLALRPADLDPAIRSERLVAMMQLMTSSLAERARLIDEGAPPRLDDRAYEVNLTDMLTGVLTAPVSVPDPC
jgi:AcrR family transcriptional regulator